MRIFNGVDELKAAAGTLVGSGEWVAVDQSRIDLFADATDDHQWIHVDPERAASGPFTTTIAHGFLTLSLLPVLIAGVYRVDSVKMGVNYGLDRVRFTSPLPVGSKVRATITLGDVTDAAGGAVQVVNNVTVDVEGAERPALIAEWLTRQYA